MNRLYNHLLGALLICASQGGQAQTTCPAFDGEIFLHSVEYTQAGEPTAAIFGYELRAQDPVRISAGGPCNFLLPTNFRPGLISTFQPGLHERAFRVGVLKTERRMLWILGEKLVDADLATATPSAPLGTLPNLPAATAGSPYSQQLAASGGQAPLTWSELGPLPDGLTLSSNGKLSGTPTTAGTFVVKARVSDGAADFASAYSLTIADGVVINDAVSTRAPGFTPQFRLVSATARSPEAIAQCDANEFVVTGGAACTGPNGGILRGLVASSQPNATGWAVKCAFGAATAIAVCSAR